MLTSVWNSDSHILIENDLVLNKKTFNKSTLSYLLRKLPGHFDYPLEKKNQVNFHSKCSVVQIFLEQSSLLLLLAECLKWLFLALTQLGLYHFISTAAAVSSLVGGWPWLCRWTFVPVALFLQIIMAFLPARNRAFLARLSCPKHHVLFSSPSQPTHDARPTSQPLDGVSLRLRRGTGECARVGPLGPKIG